MKKLGIYIHIPFCLAKCRYCGFYSRGGASAAEMETYVESLICDIEEYGRIYGDGCRVDTVFLGGGTPSILPAGAVSRIMGSLRAAFFVEEDAEITMESNPKTLTEAGLEEYRRSGVNRLSIGVQSLDRGCLERLGRVHTAEDFLENYRLARNCGFDNINVDLMFAVPGHTMEIWMDTLERIIGLSPEHISFYSLQIEEGTPFYDMLRTGEIEEIPDDLDRRMYHRAIAVMKEAGYEHYEISNCAKPGYRCRHNLKYWSMDDYLGIGAAASSFAGGVRFSEAPLMEFHENTLEDTAGEFVFTGLRKTCGIRFDDFRRITGQDFWQYFGSRRGELEEFFKAGQLIETPEGLRLSEKGIDVSNRIMAVFV
ncbi:MAG: radical SAM family heme chaperone HemW [Emergencia sp.]